MLLFTSKIEVCLINSNMCICIGKNSLFNPWLNKKLVKSNSFNDRKPIRLDDEIYSTKETWSRFVEFVILQIFEFIQKGFVKHYYTCILEKSVILVVLSSGT